MQPSVVLGSREMKFAVQQISQWNDDESLETTPQTICVVGPCHR